MRFVEAIFASFFAAMIYAAVAKVPHTPPSWIRERINAKIAADERAAAAAMENVNIQRDRLGVDVCISATLVAILRHDHQAPGICSMTVRSLKIQ